MINKKLYKCCEYFKEKKLMMAFLINVVFLLFSLIFCVSKYEVSDDFIMENILSGAMTNGPNSYILFVNIILTNILKGLYLMNSNISWYYIFMLVLAFFSFVSVTYVILKKTNIWIGIMLSTLFISSFMNDIYILPQFTKTSMLSICSGLILVFYSVLLQKSKTGVIMGSLLCILGSLLRFECFFMAAFFGALIWIVELGRRIYAGEKLKKIFSLLIILLIVSTIIIFFQKIHVHAYENNDEYQYFYEYSKARSRILDYKDFGYSAYEEELTKLGISYNDYLMIRKWNFADPKVFDLDTMQKVGNIVYEYHKNNHMGVRQIYDAILERRIMNYPIFIAFIILGLVIILLDFKRFYVVMTSMMALLFGLILMYFRNRIVYRVEFGLFLGAFLMMLYLWLSKNEISAIKSYKSFLILTFLFCISKAPFIIPDNSYKVVLENERKGYIDEVFLASENYDGRKYRRAVSKGVPENNLMKYILVNKENFYFLDFSTTIQTLYYDFTPIESAANISFENSQYLAGVTSQHPEIEKKMETFGINNPMKDLVKDNVYLVDNNSIDMKIEYLKQHYYKDVKAVLVKEIEGYKIWKIKEN